MPPETLVKQKFRKKTCRNVANFREVFKRAKSMQNLPKFGSRPLLRQWVTYIPYHGEK
jgi:hypothetical protein